MNTRIISTKPLRPGDPVARDLIGWTNRAYKLGKKNPFIELQGIHGKTTFENLIKQRADKSLVLDIPFKTEANSFDDTGLINLMVFCLTVVLVGRLQLLTCDIF